MGVITPRPIGIRDVVLIESGVLLLGDGLVSCNEDINRRLCPASVVSSSKPDYLHFIPITIGESHDTRYLLPSSIHIGPFGFCIYFSSPK